MQTTPSMHFAYETIMVGREVVTTASEAQQAIQVTSPQGYGLRHMSWGAQGFYVVLWEMTQHRKELRSFALLARSQRGHQEVSGDKN